MAPTDELKQKIEEAFDYRGDITLTLKGGEEVVGYLFNREFAPHKGKEQPFVELYLPAGGRRKLSIDTIESVALSGEDHAVPWSPEEKN